MALAELGNAGAMRDRLLERNRLQLREMRLESRLVFAARAARGWTGLVALAAMLVAASIIPDAHLFAAVAALLLLVYLVARRLALECFERKVLRTFSDRWKTYEPLAAIEQLDQGPKEVVRILLHRAHLLAYGFALVGGMLVILLSLTLAIGVSLSSGGWSESATLLAAVNPMTRTAVIYVGGAVLYAIGMVVAVILTSQGTPSRLVSWLTSWQVVMAGGGLAAYAIVIAGGWWGDGRLVGAAFGAWTACLRLSFLLLRLARREDARLRSSTAGVDLHHDSDTIVTDDR